MRIKVVSRNIARAEQVAEIVRASAAGLDVLAATGSQEALPAAINGSRPGLVVLDGVDAAGLDAIERLTHANPEVELIVISAEQSPAFLLKAMQAGVREVLPPPVSAAALQAAVQRYTRKHALVPSARQGEVLAFMACKGGSGATFLAANLAHVLSNRGGHTVGLLDLDLQFGDALLMLSDQRPASDVAEVARNIGRLDMQFLRSAMVPVSETLSVLPAPAELSQALEVKAAHIEAIIKQARQMFDFVVLDVGRSIDALSLQALDQATSIFPVLQLSLPQARDAKRLRALFRSLEYSPQKISWLVNRYQKGGDITLESLQQTLGSEGLRTIPNHFAAVSAAVNQGVPIDRLSRNNPVARALQKLAASIAPVEDAKKDGWLSSMFGGA
ncbi:MAG: AAA family ATPase [Methylibium sp.]|nr:AAA family ATPase [Methylibium sp.]MBA3623174.1 AAA family ATPase [Methylibium sp.]